MRLFDRITKRNDPYIHPYKPAPKVVVGGYAIRWGHPIGDPGLLMTPETIFFGAVENQPQLLNSTINYQYIIQTPIKSTVHVVKFGQVKEINFDDVGLHIIAKLNREDHPALELVRRNMAGMRMGFTILTYIDNRGIDFDQDTLICSRFPLLAVEAYNVEKTEESA